MERAGTRILKLINNALSLSKENYNRELTFGYPVLLISLDFDYFLPLLLLSFCFD